jgi:hypothetical protein
MGQIIRIAEVDARSGVVKEPRFGANGSVEVFALPDPLASDLIVFVEEARVDSVDLLVELAEIRQWYELLTRRSMAGRWDETGIQELGSPHRRLIAAQYLRMRCENARLDQIDGYEAAADYELSWHTLELKTED